MIKQNEVEIMNQNKIKRKNKRGTSTEVVMRLQGYGQMYEERRNEKIKDIKNIEDCTFKPSLNKHKNLRIKPRYMSQTPGTKLVTNLNKKEFTFKPKICKVSSIIARKLVIFLNRLG